MPAFNIKINEADLMKVKNIFSDIGKNLAARVTMRALNKTLSGVKTDSSSAIRDIITAKKSAVDETFKISRATEQNSSAWIASTGRPIALIDYSARETKKGVSVQVRKDRARKVVPGAFIATMKSGHKGVYWRKWHGTKSGKMRKNDSAINRSGYVWSAKMKRFISIAWLAKQYRLPIMERFGPRIPDIMENEPVMKGILSSAGDRLHKNLMHEMDYELSKHK